MKNIGKIFFLFIIVYTNSCRTANLKEFKTIKLPTNQFEKDIENWDMFLPAEKSVVVVHDYFPAAARCGRGLIHGVAIAKNLEDDTLRIIDQCPGYTDYKLGDTLLFEPAKSYPQNLLDGLLSFNYKESILGYKRVKKTTFGRLTK